MKFKNEILLLLISSSITIMLSVLLGEIYVFLKINLIGLQKELNMTGN